VLLESVEGGEQLGRWSFVVSNPLWTLTCRGEQAVRQWRDGRRDDLAGNPFLLLRQCLASIRPAPIPHLPPAHLSPSFHPHVSRVYACSV
jgi:anthranilate synthase component 1